MKDDVIIKCQKRISAAQVDWLGDISIRLRRHIVKAAAGGNKIGRSYLAYPEAIEREYVRLVTYGRAPLPVILEFSQPPCLTPRIA